MKNLELCEEIKYADNAIQFAWTLNMGYKQNFCCDFLFHGDVPVWEDAEELDYSSAMEEYEDDIREYIVGTRIDNDGTIFEESDISCVEKFVMNPDGDCVLALINW